MRLQRNNNAGGFVQFFRLILSDRSLEGIFRINFGLMQYHNYTLADIENMMPWERDIYVNLLQQHIKEENDKIREQNRKKV